MSSLPRVAIILLLCLAGPSLAWAKGVALVIGNSTYANVAGLDNPSNDARAVASALEVQGFDVRLYLDLDRTRMRNALREFRGLADGADVALVYYAGHGIEIAGVNYLIPVDARLEDERDAGLEMVQIDLILRQISGAKTLKMVVLDACRNNPFVVRMKRENAGRNVGVGLGRVAVAEADTLIAYAAAAGEVTPDGEPGGHSPFTRAFLNALDGPPADVRRLLGRARDELRQSLPGAAPFVYTSLGGAETVINPLGRSEPRATPDSTPNQKTTSGASISQDFVRIDRSGTREDWDAFLIRWEAQSDHPLYAFALEKRAALQHQEPVAPADRTPVKTAPEDQVEPPEPVLIRTRDEAARALQQDLKARGCYRSTIDGVLGRGSQRGLATLGQVIAADLSLTSRATAEEIEAVIARMQAAPGAVCPVTTVRKTRPATGNNRIQNDKVQKKLKIQTATETPAQPEAEADSSTSYSRKDSTKLTPVIPSDCVGNRKKFYDCD